MKRKFYIELIFLILLGVLTSFSLPPFNYFIINFLTFSLFYIFLVKKVETNKNKKIFFLYGWLFGFGYFVSNLYWISISLTFDQNFEFLIPFTIILIPGFLALFYALVAYLFVVLKTNKNLSSFFLFSLIFWVVEFIRVTIITGFPWNLSAYSFSNYIEILNITSVIGTYSFNLFCISLFISPSIFILKEKRKDITICIAFLITTLSFFVYGSQNIDKFHKAKINQHDYKIRIVGSNISIDRFLFDIDPVSTINELIETSNLPKNEKIILIWPEGILPGLYQDTLIEFDWLFSDNLNKNHILVLGINSKITENEIIKYFNSLSIYDHKLNLINSYNKIKLVPFGEFLPMENLLRSFGLSTITNIYQSYTSGSNRKILDIKTKEFSLKILPLICYEIIYSGRLFQNNDFDFILNISEDGWFGNSIGPSQHFAHNIFRAIESGKYILRSTNNGITAIINPIGVVEKKLNLNEIGYIDFTESREIKPTLFSQYGNKIFGLIILLYIFLIFSFKKLRNE